MNAVLLVGGSNPRTHPTPLETPAARYSTDAVVFTPTTRIHLRETVFTWIAAPWARRRAGVARPEPVLRLASARAVARARGAGSATPASARRRSSLRSGSASCPLRSAATERG